MAERVRSFDWASTTLGPIKHWPQSLKTAVELVLGSRVPSQISWGPDLRIIYNDAYVSTLGGKHPAALGLPFYEVWPDPALTERIASVLRGHPVAFVDEPFETSFRPGQPIGWLTGGWSAVRDETGAIRGFYTNGVETTHHIEAERALRESEEHLRHVVAYSPYLTWTATPDGLVDAASPQNSVWFGVSGLGRTWQERLHPEDRDRVLAISREGHATGQPHDSQHRMLMEQTGEYRWVRARVYPRHDAEGRLIRWYGTMEDIHEYKLAEQALREREEQQAFLLQLSDAIRPLADPCAIKAEACRRLGDHLNTSHCYYVEVREAEGVGIIDHDHVIGDASPLVGTYSLADFHRQALYYRQGRPLVVTGSAPSPHLPEAECSFLAKLGIIAWIGVPLVKHGELVGILFAIRSEPYDWPERDIALVIETGERIWAATERARAERAAREADMRLRTLADAAPVLIWDVDASGTVFVNDHYRRFFGIELDAVSGSGWANLLHPEDAEGYFAAYDLAYRHRTPFHYEARVRHADGGYRWLDSTGRPVGAERFVGFSIDVTERRLAEQQLRRNNALLRAITVVFGETLSASSAEELARIALQVVEDLTDSPVGFLALNGEKVSGLKGLCLSQRGLDRFGGPPPADSDASRQIEAIFGLDIDACCKWVLREGRGIIANDLSSRPAEIGKSELRQTFDAFLGVPLKQGERICGLIGLCDRVGGYRCEDLETIEALAPAIWHALHSKQAELRLRESEQRFRQFAEASSDVLWIRDAETGDLEFISPAVRSIYGVTPDQFAGGLHVWVAHLVPEDRERILRNLEKVRAGQAVASEFRIMRANDGAFRWLRSTMFPLRDEQGRVRRIGGLSSDTTEAKILSGHQAVLLAELQHRVRNIMAVTRSIVARTGERAESVAEYASLVGGRLLTLARVQALLTRSAGAGVDVATIVRDEVSAQALRDDQYDLSGPKIELSPKAAEVLTLAVHELATNALKYGALSVSEGRIRVRWTTFFHRDETWLYFRWVEEGAPCPVSALRRGFGSELIEDRLPYELGGQGRLTIGPDGARGCLKFPLRDGSSILGTDAPQRATVFGGTLDMAGQSDFSGHRILVVEDDYYLATDTARALKNVGAEVIGPCPNEDTAREALRHDAPTAALVDINLGAGPSFTLAHLLREKKIPFVFITGYDDAVIPPDFAAVKRLQKPVELKRVVGFLAETLRFAPYAS